MKVTLPISIIALIVSIASIVVMLQAKSTLDSSAHQQLVAGSFQDIKTVFRIDTTTGETWWLTGESDAKSNKVTLRWAPIQEPDHHSLLDLSPGH